MTLHLHKFCTTFTIYSHPDGIYATLTANVQHPQHSLNSHISTHSGQEQPSCHNHATHTNSLWTNLYIGKPTPPECDNSYWYTEGEVKSWVTEKPMPFVWTPLKREWYGNTGSLAVKSGNTKLVFILINIIYGSVANDFSKWLAYYFISNITLLTLEQHIFNVGKAATCFYKIKNESAVQGWERVRRWSNQKPQPHTTNPWKEEKEKIVGDEKKEQIRPTGKHWLSS